MYHRILISLLLVLPVLLNAQDNAEGQVTFLETVKLNIELPDDVDQSLLDKIPKEQSSTRTLYFTSTQSLFKDGADQSDEHDDITAAEGDAVVQIKVVRQSADSKLYRNYADQKMVNSQDFMGKRFLIKDELKKQQWKMTTEQKQILGYPCMKAILQDTSQQVVAWFTTQIPSPAGPGSYGQLPGLILEVEIDEGERRFLASNVDLKKLDEDKITIPTKGKKVTSEEMDAIIEKKTKEMEEQSGGNRVIRWQTN